MSKQKITVDEIRKKLWTLQDKEYKEFHSKIIPNISSENIIGIRVPILRNLAKELMKEWDCSEFLQALPHTYYEENNLHAFLLEEIKDYSMFMKELERFLPYIDNWATCDSFSPKILKKHTSDLLKNIQIWIQDKETYTIRFGIKMLMNHFLDKNFKVEYLKWVADIYSEEYYVNMMRAWFFATALAKQYERTITCIETKQLHVWTHNKSIQKAIESNRISKDKKDYLRRLKQ